MLTLRQRTVSYYVLTALTTLAFSFYFNYLFFYLRDTFGFGNRENLWVSAVHGFIYIFAAWQCGRFAERHGNHLSLKIGYAGLTICMIAAGLVQTSTMHVVVLACYTVVLLFIWPAVEALAITGQPPGRLPHMAGIYNCTWSGAAAVAYFAGGPLYDAFGRTAVFWIPAALFAAQFVFAWRYLRGEPPQALAAALHPTDPAAQRLRVSPQTFLTLAWTANPFSYVTIYTLFAVMPGLAARLGLSPTEVGLFCSIWLFGRLAAFVVLWQWTGWHYRFRYLTAAYLLVAASFLAIVLAPALWVLVAAQVVFGLATGLIYYSSLFYSMDVGEAKTEHGGLHEAAIGVGIFAGPAVSAASLQFFPNSPMVTPVAVTALLGVGFVILAGIWAKGLRRG